MNKAIVLTVSDARPLRHGLDYLWSLILQLTRETDIFFYRDIRGMCDQECLGRVRRDLAKLVKTGFLERLPETRSKRPRPYRVLKRQSDTPSLRTDLSGESRMGDGIQQMWNVMRRERGGFTVMELAVAASTDDVAVSHQHAKQYCLLLERAGMLRKQRTGQRGVGRNIYVLLGTANSGPKPPRRYKAVMVYDQNRNIIVGPVQAEEASS